MKKQQTKKKLVVNKETLASLQHISGGSYLWNTVYYPQETEYRCPSNGCGIS